MKVCTRHDENEAPAFAVFCAFVHWVVMETGFAATKDRALSCFVFCIFFLLFGTAPRLRPTAPPAAWSASSVLEWLFPKPRDGDVASAGSSLLPPRSMESTGPCLSVGCPSGKTTTGNLWKKVSGPAWWYSKGASACCCCSAAARPFFPLSER